MNNLYVIEGIDGAGKTSLINLLEKNLVLTTNLRIHSCPGITAYGRLARSYLESYESSCYDAKNIDIQVALLALIDFHQGLKTQIDTPTKLSYSLNILDRYYLSTVAYLETHKEIDTRLSRALLDLCIEILPKPSTIFYLDIPVETALSRLKSREGSLHLYETKERLTIVKHRYDQILKYLSSVANKIVVIDANTQVEDITTEVIEIINAGNKTKDPRPTT